MFYSVNNMLQYKHCFEITDTHNVTEAKKTGQDNENAFITSNVQFTYIPSHFVQYSHLSLQQTDYSW